MNRTSLKALFQTGDTPTQGNFADLIDSFANDERMVATSSVAGATTLVIDSTPVQLYREGKVAIGVGLATCEIREVSSVTTVTLTLNDALFNAHDANERVLFFQSTRVPTAWWGLKGSDTAVDNRYALQCALRAIGRAQGTGGSPLTLDGQWRDYYLSGPVTLVNGTEIENQRWRAKTTGGGYTGPKDGPENATYETNAMVMLAQGCFPYTYSAATNTFTVTTAAGVATAHIAGVDSRIIFDADPSAPTDLVTGRVYFAESVPTSSTFKVKQTIAGSVLPAWGSDGSGWCYIGVLDNVKLYARRWWLDGSDIGLFSLTAAASTDVFTTSSAHGFANDDAIRLTLGAGTFPTGVTQSVKYFARDVASTTFKVAATAGGAAIDITVDGVADVRSWDKCLNGAILGMQQPSFLEHVRVDNFKGFGVRVQAQQSYWPNLELIDNGCSLEIGGETSVQAGLFVWVTGINSEAADHTDILFRVAKAIHLQDIHIEETGDAKVTIFDIRCPIYGFIVDGSSWITAGSNKTLFKFQAGQTSGVDYKIGSLRGTFPSEVGCIAIDDRDRGTYLDMWTDFGGGGWDEYSAWSTGVLSRTDPHPVRWDGVNGASEWSGSGYASYPHKVTRLGALKTSDIHQYKTWTALSGTITLDLDDDTFTRTAHGFTEGQEIFVYSGSSQTSTGAEAWLNSTIYRVRNPTADAFQISHTPVSTVLNFTASGGLTNWIIKSVAPLKFRINKDARVVSGHATAIADADLAEGEWAVHFDPATGDFVLKGKKTGGTTVTKTLTPP